MTDSTETTVRALTHAECGHVAAVAGDDPAGLDQLAADYGHDDPQWEVLTLAATDAIDRLLAGRCHYCRVEPPS